LASGVRNVLLKDLNPWQAAAIAVSGLHLLHSTESPSRRSASISRPHATTLELARQ
jgi:hypothetical protein